MRSPNPALLPREAIRPDPTDEHGRELVVVTRALESQQAVQQPTGKSVAGRTNPQAVCKSQKWGAATAVAHKAEYRGLHRGPARVE